MLGKFTLLYVVYTILNLVVLRTQLIPSRGMLAFCCIIAPIALFAVSLGLAYRSDFSKLLKVLYCILFPVLIAFLNWFLIRAIWASI